ncbi:hypothetical protein [Streptomyces sp. enrichment culture]|uniref:hypothetical protein n=1 Tax=Streptomyces sp. enrichment culture TaxID=1795815 RepID=UPI003F568E84
MSTAPSPLHGRLWPRALLLLLALLLPAAHPAASPTAPALAVPGESVEYDALDTALRAPYRASHRSAAPPRPAPALHRPAAPAAGPGRPAPAPPRPPHTLPTLRTVVLRC